MEQLKRPSGSAGRSYIYHTRALSSVPDAAHVDNDPDVIRSLTGPSRAHTQPVDVLQPDQAWPGTPPFSQCVRHTLTVCIQQAHGAGQPWPRHQGQGWTTGERGSQVRMTDTFAYQLTWNLYAYLDGYRVHAAALLSWSLSWSPRHGQIWTVFDLHHLILNIQSGSSNRRICAIFTSSH